MKKLNNRREVWTRAQDIHFVCKVVGGIAQNETQLTREDLVFELNAIQKLEDAILEYRAAIRCGLVDCVCGDEV